MLTLCISCGLQTNGGAMCERCTPRKNKDSGSVAIKSLEFIHDGNSTKIVVNNENKTTQK